MKTSIIYIIGTAFAIGLSALMPQSSSWSLHGNISCTGTPAPPGVTLIRPPEHVCPACGALPLHTPPFQPALPLEPRNQYRRALRQLTGVGKILLHTQPLSRMVQQPQEHPHGSAADGCITTTARIIGALRRALPKQTQITWRTTLTSRINEPEGYRALAPNAEPIFFCVTQEQLSRAGNLSAAHTCDTLDIGLMNSDSLLCGKEWLHILETLLMERPELRDITPAATEELVTAISAMKQASNMVRATIIHYTIKLDETAGLARVRYNANLRDPQQGGMIKGALRDWCAIAYERSFPLNDLWRQAYNECMAGKRGTCCSIPVILSLEETTNPLENCWKNRYTNSLIKVLCAYDTENDISMWRAINEADFHPWTLNG